MRSRNLMILAAGGLLFAAPLAGQDHQQPPAMGMPGGGQMMGMMMGMQPSPQMVLRMRQALELTEEQVQRIQVIGGEAHQAHHSHMEAAMQAMQAAEQLLQADRPDWTRYETQFRQAADDCVRAHLAMSRAMVDTRDVLTAEQRAGLKGALAVMREMMQGQMQGMMGGMGPGMMQHDQHPPGPMQRPR